MGLPFLVQSIWCCIRLLYLYRHLLQVRKLFFMILLKILFSPLSWDTSSSPIILRFGLFRVFQIPRVFCVKSVSHLTFSLTDVSVSSMISLVPEIISIFCILLVGFILRSLIYLTCFVHGCRYGSICIPLHVDIQICQHQLLKMQSFLHCIILALV